MSRTIYDDPVVAEIHEIRQLLLEECGDDIDAYRKRVRQQQESSDRRIIRQPFRKRTEQSDELER